MSQSNNSRKRSSVWLHFSVVNESKARCDICIMELSIKGGSISNLGKNLRLKHVSVADDASCKTANCNQTAGAGLD